MVQLAHLGTDKEPLSSQILLWILKGSVHVLALVVAALIPLIRFVRRLREGLP